jgi:deoxycytidylate deaminase
VNYLELAIKEARLNPIKPIGRNSISRFAAILVGGSRTFIGKNSYRTHPMQKKFGCNESCIHIHAEIDSIVTAMKWIAWTQGMRYNMVDDLSMCDMYVARVLKDGTPALARPCEGCWRAITAFGIRNVGWTV